MCKTFKNEGWYYRATCAIKFKIIWYAASLIFDIALALNMKIVTSGLFFQIKQCIVPCIDWLIGEIREESIRVVVVDDIV